MSTKPTVADLVAEINAIMARVRELELGATRGAALQCLADARLHLERAQSSRASQSNLEVRKTASEAFRRSRELLRGIVK